MVDASIGVPLGLAGIAGIVWLVRLEGRQNTHEAECLLRQEQSKEFREEVRSEFKTINTKLDKALGLD